MYCKIQDYYAARSSYVSSVAVQSLQVNFSNVQAEPRRSTNSLFILPSRIIFFNPEKNNLSFS